MEQAQQAKDRLGESEGDYFKEEMLLGSYKVEVVNVYVPNVDTKSHIKEVYLAHKPTVQNAIHL